MMQNIMLAVFLIDAVALVLLGAVILWHMRWHRRRGDTL